MIVRVPVGKPVLENTGEVLMDELVDIDTDLEREGEFVAVLHTESVDEMLVVVEPLLHGETVTDNDIIIDELGDNAPLLLPALNVGRCVPSIE